MKRTLVLLALGLAMAGALAAQPEPSRRIPLRPIEFGLSGGFVSDGGGFLSDIGTRLTLVPRVWVRLTRGLALQLEAMGYKERPSNGGKVRVWPGALLSFDQGPTQLGLGIVVPNRSGGWDTPRFKINFGYRARPLLVMLFAVTRFQAAFSHNLFGLDVGVRF